jgi:hypothetical protein
MNINPKTLLLDSGVGEEIAVMLEQAIAQHTDTGRTARVSFVITVKADKESGKSKAIGRTVASLPDGDEDTVTKKCHSIGLFTINTGDHPNQQTLFDDAAEPEAAPGKDDDLTVEVVIARLNLAIAGSGKNVSAYAKKHRLPYLALSELLSIGKHRDDTYGPIYDHALTLATDESAT